MIRDLRLSPYAVSVLLRRNDLAAPCEVTIYNYIRSGIIPDVTMDQMAYRKRKNKREMVRRLPRRKDLPSIDDRPAEVSYRCGYGHWEMDTVYSGKGCSSASLLVLTERMTLQELVYKIPDRTAASVVKCLDKIERKTGRIRFKQIFKTITVDNGAEFMDYDGITKRNRTKLYYCHPYRSGERGSNENQNKLIRRWIPKGDDIRMYSDQDIRQIQDWINELPRKKFNGLRSKDLVKMHINIT